MRVLYGDNGTLTDISAAMTSYKSGTHTFSYVSGQDYIYLGSDLPFNHFYVKMGGTVNAIASTMAVELWDGKEWVAVAEVRDGTNGLFQSGMVEIVPDKDEDWQRESTNHNGDQITGLTSVTIYDMYWVRVSFGTTMTPSTVLSWMGNLFSDDNDLYGEYPVFNSTALKTQFESGKTTWEEQHVRAAEMVIKDLKSKQVVLSGSQILERDDYRLASVCKTAQIIFTAMGDDYVDDAATAKKEYDMRMDLSVHKIDLNNDGILDVKERFSRVGFFSR
jgi:hypothetical protein